MARVQETNADQYLTEHATIFAYNPASRMLLWSRYDKGAACWELHKNGKRLGRGSCPGVAREANLTTHWELVRWLHDKQPKLKFEQDTGDYIRGRIAPDKKTIYVHDLKSRYCVDDLRLGFDRHVKFALKKVGMYMKSEKKGLINYDITKRQFNRIAAESAW